MRDTIFPIQRFNESRGDSSIIRSALEVNPFLTISALAECIVENIVASLITPPNS
jgi:hypothetical protein